MVYIRGREPMVSNLCDAIRKAINESGCTYGEATSILRTLTQEYVSASHNVIIGKKPVIPAEEE